MGQDKYTLETEANLQGGAKDSGYMGMKLFIDHSCIIYNKVSNVQLDNILITTELFS